MDTSKQTVSVVLFFLFSTMSILCFFDVSSIVFLLSEMYQLINNRRNMILLCHFILLFIVKDSGLLSPRRNESSVFKENRGAAIEKEREFEVKEVTLERKEGIEESHIHRSLDIVVMEEREEVIETDIGGELAEEVMEVTENNGEEEGDDWSDEEVDHNVEEIWEEIERSEVEEEMEKDCAALSECNGEEEQDIEIEELNKKFEEFIQKFKQQMSQQTV